MRWTKVCPLVGAALLACATEETENLGPSGAPPEGGSASAGSSPQAGTGGSNAAGSATGGSSTAGSSSGGASAGTGGGGSSSGGTFNNAGSGGSAGTFSASGSANAGSGGAAGAGGNGGGGGNAGASAGSGGKAGGGAGGTGGAPPTQCTGVVIPAKTSWQGSALRATQNDPPSRVFDGDDTTRFATGSAQVGDEWLQIDFGEIVTLNEIRLHTNNNDYFRHYQLRLSNTSQDFAAEVLKEADGISGTITVPLTQAEAGRYLTIRQTGMITPTWWSLHEVSVACK